MVTLQLFLVQEDPRCPSELYSRHRRAPGRTTDLLVKFCQMKEIETLVKGKRFKVQNRNHSNLMIKYKLYTNNVIPLGNIYRCFIVTEAR